jgi:hypothetical protein
LSRRCAAGLELANQCPRSSNKRGSGRCRGMRIAGRRFHLGARNGPRKPQLDRAQGLDLDRGPSLVLKSAKPTRHRPSDPAAPIAISRVILSSPPAPFSRRAISLFRSPFLRLRASVSCQWMAVVSVEKLQSHVVRHLPSKVPRIRLLRVPSRIGSNPAPHGVLEKT